MIVLPGDSKYDTAPLPGEPYFLLLARDEQFARLVRQWAQRREEDVQCGERPSADQAKVVESRTIAANGADWRLRNAGAWLNKMMTAKEPSALTPPALASNALPPPYLVELAKAAILRVSSDAPVPLGIVLAFMNRESGFNPKAVAKGSSAAGLFQFIHSTWTQLVAQVGAEYGVGYNDIFDPRANLLIGVHLIKSYINYLRSMQFDTRAGSAYCLHFLGFTAGAKLIKSAAGHDGAHPANMEARLLFPIAAMANPEVFRPNSITLGQLYTELSLSMNGMAAAYEANYPTPAVPMPPAETPTVTKET